MTRQQEITALLKYFYQFKEKNPNNFNTSLIYSNLYNYKIVNNEIDINDENISYHKEFDYLKKYYQNQDNIRVFDHIFKPGFLQINNITEYNDTDYVKMYLSVEPTKFLVTVTRLFNLIKSYPQIKHFSKVSITPRSDQITLNIKNPQHAKFIADSINADSDMVSAARLTNPFIPRYGIIALGYDMDLSYNDCVSYLIESYLESKNNIDEVNNADFYEYIRRFYSMLTSENETEDMKKLCASDLFRENFARIASYEDKKVSFECVLNNYLNVFEEILYLYNSDSEKNFDSFEKMYGYAIDSEVNTKKQEFLRNKLSRIKREILESYVTHIYEKYVTEPNFELSDISQRLIDFMQAKCDPNNKQKAENYITRENNFRNLFSLIEVSDINRLNEEYGNILAFVEKVVGYSSSSEVPRYA